MAVAETGPPPIPLALSSPPPPRSVGWPAGLFESKRIDPVPIGVGHLRAKELLPSTGTDWLRGVLFPVYERPGGRHSGWLAHGWWLELTAAGPQLRPLRSMCLVETAYETASFVVFELREDGWFRFGYERPCERSGSAWAHESRLAFGGTALAVERWEDLFTSGRTSPLFFRDLVGHRLRARPSLEASVVDVLSGPSHSIYPLELAGDWMRVRVAQPPDQCRSPGEWRGKYREGWIRWRDPIKGSLLWFHPRGC